MAVLILHKSRVVDDKEGSYGSFLEEKAFELRLHKEEAFTNRAEERAASAQGTVMTKAQSLASSRTLNGDEIGLGRS